MRGPTLDEFAARVESYRPTFVYISGPYSGLVDSIKGSIGPITLSGASCQSLCTCLSCRLQRLCTRDSCNSNSSSSSKRRVRPMQLQCNGPCGSQNDSSTVAPGLCMSVIKYIVVCSAGKQVTPGELLTALEGAPLDTIYLDAAGQEKGM